MSKEGWHAIRVTEPGIDTPLSRTAASAAVADIGWRYLLDALAVTVPVRSLAQAAIVDPAGQQPPVWFQQMDVPRPQRNRVHFDITVAHDEAEARVRAAVAAGGRLINDSFAPSFWVLADAEGNEVCVCTWTGRDERE